MRPRLIALVLLLVGLANAARASEARIAVVTGIVHGLEVQTAGQTPWKSATVWTTLGRGDALRTAADQQASVMFADGSQMKLDEKTEVVVRGYTLDARRGRISLLVQGNRKPYQVTTPNAVAGIEGTELEVDVADDTTVRCAKGAVAVTARNGYSYRVEAMHECSIGSDGAVSGPRNIGRRAMEWAKGVRHYTEVKAQVQDNIVSILAAAKRQSQSTEVRNASPSDRLNRLHGLLRRLNTEIAAFADIEAPPLFLRAHTHRQVALETLSLALRQLELGIVTGEIEKGREKAVRLVQWARLENEIADRQYMTFERIYAKIRERLERPPEK